MTTPPFGRLVTAMITPFDASGEIDLLGARRLASHLVEHGSDAIVVSGTTGESPTLEDREKLALLEAVAEQVGGKAKIIAGTSTYDTRHSVKLTKEASSRGIDGILAVTPYYNRPGQAGLIAHFEAMAEVSSAPLMLYNIPSRTGRKIEIETIVKLADHPNICAVKDAVGDLAFTARTVNAVPEDFYVYSGDDALTLPMMAVGAVGVVSVASHLAGRAISRMMESFVEGKVAEAQRLHLQLLGLFDGLFVEPNPIPLKAALEMCKMPSGNPRLPLTPATSRTRETLKDLLLQTRELLDIEFAND